MLPKFQKINRELSQVTAILRDLPNCVSQWRAHLVACALIGDLKVPGAAGLQVILTENISRRKSAHAIQLDVSRKFFKKKWAPDTVIGLIKID